MLYSFNMDGFLRSMPSENQEYFAMLRETQGKLRRLDFGNWSADIATQPSMSSSMNGSRLALMTHLSGFSTR